jgi:hypothetical protein
LEPEDTVRHEDIRKFGEIETEDELSYRRANEGIYGASKWQVPDGGTREDEQYLDDLRGNQEGWM